MGKTGYPGGAARREVRPGDAKKRATGQPVIVFHIRQNTHISIIYY
jgi:hypothetical protein